MVESALRDYDSQSHICLPLGKAALAIASTFPVEELAQEAIEIYTEVRESRERGASGVGKQKGALDL